jgi:hypothetical protein
MKRRSWMKHDVMARKATKMLRTEVLLGWSQLSAKKVLGPSESARSCNVVEISRMQPEILFMKNRRH